MSSLLQWNFTLDDTSPMFTYKPYGDVVNGSNPSASLSRGWQTWYTGSGFLSSTGASPSGDSYHLTSLSGASVSLSFYGTGISLSGMANCSYGVILDGTIISSATITDNIFYQVSNLSPETHNVTITAQPSSSSEVFGFNEAIVISVANSTVQSPIDLSIDNQNTSVITYAGNWTPDKVVSDVPSASTSLPFHTTTDLGASALLDFSGRAVAVYGSSTSNHGQYSITLDGKQYVLNGTSEWLLGNMLMFYQDGLDDSVLHSINITNFGDEEALSISTVDIKQFRTDESNTSSTSTSASVGTSSLSTSASVRPAASTASLTTAHHINVGAIVGPIVGVLAILVALGLFFVCRRRHRSKPTTVQPFKYTERLPGHKSTRTTSAAYPEHFRSYREASLSESMTYASSAPTDTYDPSPNAALDTTTYGTIMYDGSDGSEWRPTLDADGSRSMASVPVTAVPFSDLSQSEGDGFSPRRPRRQRRVLSGREDDIVERIVERVAARIAPSDRDLILSSSDGTPHLPSYSECS